MRVIVTRPPAESERWSGELRERGFDAVALPLIEIGAPAEPAAVRAAWASLGTFRAVMFVSANAVHQFFAHAPAGVGWPAATRAWATGAGTRHALLDTDLPPSRIDAPPPDAAQFDSETLWGHVGAQVRAGDRVLIVRGADADGNEGRDWLAARLQQAGAQVETVVSYMRRVPAWTDAQRAVAAQTVHDGSTWIFSSSQAIAHLERLMPQLDFARSRAIATHPRIAQAARDAGFGVVCESRPVIDAVVAALESIG